MMTKIYFRIEVWKGRGAGSLVPQVHHKLVIIPLQPKNAPTYNKKQKLQSHSHLGSLSTKVVPGGAGDCTLICRHHGSLQGSLGSMCKAW